jgi:hypothetical protein
MSVQAKRVYRCTTREMAPGENLRWVIDLTKMYDFGTSGIYWIDVRRPFFVESGGEAEEAIATPMRIEFRQ